VELRRIQDLSSAQYILSKRYRQVRQDTNLSGPVQSGKIMASLSSQVRLANMAGREFRISVFRKKIRGCLLHEAPVAKRVELTVGRKFEFVVQILIPTYLLS